MNTLSTIVAVLFLSSSLIFGAAEGKGKGKKAGGDKPKPAPGEIFKKLDGNGDGSVSRAEFMASPRAQKDQAKAAEHFKKLDADNNGSVSKEEFAAHCAAGKGKKEGGKKGDK